MQKTIHPLILILASSACTTVMLILLFAGWSAWAENTELDSGPRIIPYNGFLEFNGASYTGNADIKFTLTDDNQCTFIEDHEDIQIYSGRFSVNLGHPTGDLPACLFDASAVYLQMAVREGATTTPHIPLAGRQRVNPVPFAYWAAEGSDFRVDGQLMADSASLGNTAVNGALTVSNTLTANGALVTNNSVTVNNGLTMASQFAPQTGTQGINWPNDVFGGAGDDAWIQYYQDGEGENTALQIGIANDADDNIEFYQGGAVRMKVESNDVGVTNNIAVGGNANVTGNTTVGGILNAGDVQGVTHINRGGQAFEIGGNVTIGGDLSVTGSLLTMEGPHIAQMGQFTDMGADNGRRLCFLNLATTAGNCYAARANTGTWRLESAATLGNICIAHCLSW